MTARSVSDGGSPASSRPALTYCSSASIQAAIYSARRFAPSPPRPSALVRLRERRLAIRNIDRPFVFNALDEPTSPCPHACIRPAADRGGPRLRVERPRGGRVRRRPAAAGRLPADLPGDRARDRLPGPDRDAQEP